MMQGLRIPYSAFLSDYLVKDDHEYFKKMQSLGVTLNNHTLNHRYMPALSYDEQRREICDQQDKIGKWAGSGPACSGHPSQLQRGHPARPPSKAGSRPRRCGPRRPSPTTWTGASGTATCTPATLTHFRQP